MRVVVIGAGIAGLSAASELLKQGLDVCLVEARDRIGGRICKAEEFSVPIDLGASWIHGVSGNPLTEIAERVNLKLDVSDNQTLTNEGHFEIYDHEGNTFDGEIEKKK